MTNQIKIGVAVDSLTLENWKLNFIEKIRSSDEYSVNIIHIAKQKEIGPFYFFIFIYKLIDRLIFRQRCILLKKNKLKSNLILDSIVEKEPSQNLKIIFNLSLTKLKTTDFPNSKIWEIEHEDHWFLGYMSFALNKLTISSKLVQRNDNSIILTSTSAVHKNSVNKTLTNHLIKVQSFGLRSLKRISIQGDRINKDTELPNRISQKNSYLNQTKLGIYLFIRINKSFFESIKNRINSINVGEKWYILLKSAIIL